MNGSPLHRWLVKVCSQWYKSFKEVWKQSIESLEKTEQVHSVIKSFGDYQRVQNEKSVFVKLLLTRKITDYYILDLAQYFSKIINKGPQVEDQRNKDDCLCITSWEIRRYLEHRADLYWIAQVLIKSQEKWRDFHSEITYNDFMRIFTIFSSVFQNQAIKIIYNVFANIFIFLWHILEKITRQCILLEKKISLFFISFLWEGLVLKAVVLYIWTTCSLEDGIR